MERQKTILAWTVVIFLIALSIPKTQAFLVKTYEDILFMIAPSAKRAFSYGSRHMDAMHPKLYDIDRASRFFREAVALDDEYPYLNHQLARVEFLKGNLNTALYYINREIELHGGEAPNSYYVRGLIEGYMGRYNEAAEDYRRYLEHDPRNWAALNDYAWVLLKAGRFNEATEAATLGLSYFPDNPWLLNSQAIALYELGRYEEALEAAGRASVTAGEVTEHEWLTAYPGNDPRIAGEGIATLRKSIADNMHMIELALASTAVE